MILARYCSRAVFQEQIETIRSQGSALWPRNMFGLIVAWSSYLRVEAKLLLYEWYIYGIRVAGLASIASI